IGPYLDILLDPKTTYTAHIEIYSKLCAAKLNDADLIKRSQAQNLLDALAKDYMNAVYVPPSEQQRWGDLQSIYCVMYGIFPENAHKSLSMLDATSASALSAVEWSITEISSEGSQASDMLPTLMKWYHQTMIQPDDTNNWTQSNRAMQDHESLVPIILSLAGDNTKTYLTMMTHDPDSQVAQEATDSLLKLTAVPTAPVTHIQSSTEADLSNFPLAIKAAVLAAPLVYPRQAILAGTTGVTQVAFDYLNGNAINIHIASSSGDKSLDRAAMDAVQRAQYPSPPPGIVGKLIHIVVPITFSLGG
ncbi:MAG: energy transducer TonB, partial [Gammaproteobacteria bacterium]